MGWLDRLHDEGVSYNSYLIKDEKNIIIDLASEMSTDKLVEQIETIVPVADLDYVVVNHMRVAFTARHRRIPLLHRNGQDYLLSPGSERLTRVNAVQFKRFGPYRDSEETTKKP